MKLKRFLSFLMAAVVLICTVSVVSTAREATAEDKPEAAISQNETTNATGKKLIALTFDDGPGKDTKRLLDGLRKRGVHCSFFIVGQYAAYYPSTVKQCYEDGHQLCSHSYTHPFLTNLSDSEIRSEMSKTTAAVNKAVGNGSNLTLMVRPPYGDYNSRVLNVLGVPTFYWSDDSGDWWSGATADSVYHNTMKTAGDGDILLLHDSHSWSVDAALRVVDSLQAQGYEFVTLSELFRRRGVKLEAGHIYSWLRDNGTNLSGISKPVISMMPTPDGMRIAMSSDSGTTIHYTTDGSVPTTASKRYSGPFIMTQAATITAVAGYDMNGSRSDRVSVSVPKLRACAAPDISVSDGMVVINAKDTVYYTLDGSEPTTASECYQAPFEITPGTVIRAFAYSGAANTVKSASVFLYYSPNGNLFDDIKPASWYADAVDEAVSEGLMVGTADYHFSPHETVTRAQMVTILYRLSGDSIPNDTVSAFSDIKAGKWYTESCIWAEQNGIVFGYDDGLFHPQDALPREQAAAILMRFTEWCDYDTSERTSLEAFEDGNKTSSYAREAMQWAVAKGVFSGSDKGLLAPKSTLERAQMASVITRYCEYSAEWKKVAFTDDELLTLANSILPMIKEKDYSSLTAFIHPQLGLTFTPYSTVSPTDLSFQWTELLAASEAETELCWGGWDGSGEDLLLSFDAYWDRFVWNYDYTNADSILLNEIGITGNAIENVFKAYDNCMIAEYDVNSALGYNDGTDWSTLKLVFLPFDGELYLAGIIHGEWTA